MKKFGSSLRVRDLSEEKREGKEEKGESPFSLGSGPFGPYGNWVCDSESGLELVLGRIHVICGTTGSGKTTLLRATVKRNCMSFNKIWLICPTWKAAPEQYDWCPEKYKCDVPSAKGIDDVITEMKQHPEGKGLLILDDCLGQLKLGGGSGTDQWKDLSAKSRKYNLTIIIVMHKLNELNTNIREATNALFITKAGTSSMKSITEMVSDGFTGGKKEIAEFVTKYQGKDRHIIRFNLDGGKTPVSIFQGEEVGKFVLFY